MRDKEFEKACDKVVEALDKQPPFKAPKLYTEFEVFTLDTKWGKLTVEVHEYHEHTWRLVFPDVLGADVFLPKTAEALRIDNEEENRCNLTDEDFKRPAPKCGPARYADESEYRLD